MYLLKSKTEEKAPKMSEKNFEGQLEVVTVSYYVETPKMT